MRLCAPFGGYAGPPLALWYYAQHMRDVAWDKYRSYPYLFTPSPDCHYTAACISFPCVACRTFVRFVTDGLGLERPLVLLRTEAMQVVLAYHAAACYPLRTRVAATPGTAIQPANTPLPCDAATAAVTGSCETGWGGAIALQRKAFYSSCAPVLSKTALSAGVHAFSLLVLFYLSCRGFA